MPHKLLMTDVVLAGAGIMSATLGIMLKELQPGITIDIFERLDVAAAESSDAWNNAGTGHSAFCELNYTPEKEDGSIDTTKALKIADSFEVSKQLWAYLTGTGVLDKPETFISHVPHMSFVHGEKDVEYLRKRFAALTANPLFKGMQYTEDFAQLSGWMPLMMEGRDPDKEPLAATRMDIGTDVNFGALTRCLFAHLTKQPGVRMHFNHEVRALEQRKNKTWRMRVEDTTNDEPLFVSTKFIFLGAGGGALPLLLKSGIPEGKGFGGFPVSGQWLRCTNEAIIAEHSVKVYGQAPVGSPPMSVPHLDTRMIKGKKELLFGPYAGFTTRFLKHGSLMDMPFSFRLENLKPMIAAGLHNIPLTRYLIRQVRQSEDDRIEALRVFVPTARLEDWALENAGQRVQVIKKDEEEGGILEFGTEVVSAADGSLAALLGASPGASTAVSIMITVIQRCFPDAFASEAWQHKLRTMIPSFGQSLAKDEAMLARVREWTSRALQLEA